MRGQNMSTGIKQEPTSPFGRSLTNREGVIIMPFDRFIDISVILEERRHRIQQSLRAISIDELNELARKHQDEFPGIRWREEFLALMADRPHANFYHAVPQDGVEVLYCRDAEFGIWVLPGSGIGLLDAEGKRLMNEAIETRSLAQNIGGRKMEMLNTTLVMAVVFAALTLGACTKKEERPAVVRPVRSIVVEKRQLGGPAVGTGHLRARDEVNLAFRIGGRVLQRKVGVGDRVEAGQLV